MLGPNDQNNEEAKTIDVTEQKNKTEEENQKMKKIMEQIKLIMIVKLLKDDGKPVEVIPNLYIGSIGTAYSKENLKQRNIQYILTVCDQKKSPFIEDFTYMKFDILDSLTETILDKFDQANKFIDNAIKNNVGVLVHWQGRQIIIFIKSFAGKSRSTSFVLAYLMAYQNMKLDESLALVKSKRPIVQPNESILSLIIQNARFYELTTEKENQKELKKADLDEQKE